MDDRELNISPAQLAYRTVLLAAGLLLFGLLFRQLVTLLLAILMTIIIAIPLAAAARRLERYRIPRPVGALIALLGGIGTLALIIYLLIPPFVDQTNAVRGRRAVDRQGPRGRLRRRDRPERRRGRRQGPELRRALHRRARPADRPAHLDRPERGRHPRRARADPDHLLLHGDPARAAGRRPGAARAAAAPRARPLRARPHPPVVDRLDGGRRHRHARHVRDALRRAHDRGPRLRDLLRGPVGAARGRALLRRDRRRDARRCCSRSPTRRARRSSCSARTSSCSSSRAT